MGALDRFEIGRRIGDGAAGEIAVDGDAHAEICAAYQRALTDEPPPGSGA